MIPEIYEVIACDKTQTSEVLYAAGDGSADALHRASLYCDEMGLHITGFSKMKAASAKMVWETRDSAGRLIIGREAVEDGS